MFRSAKNTPARTLYAYLEPTTGPLTRRTLSIWARTRRGRDRRGDRRSRQPGFVRVVIGSACKTRSSVFSNQERWQLPVYESIPRREAFKTIGLGAAVLAAGRSPLLGRVLNRRKTCRRPCGQGQRDRVQGRQIRPAAAALRLRRARTRHRRGDDEIHHDIHHAAYVKGVRTSPWRRWRPSPRAPATPRSPATGTTNSPSTAAATRCTPCSGTT